MQHNLITARRITSVGIFVIIFALVLNPFFNVQPILAQAPDANSDGVAAPAGTLSPAALQATGDLTGSWTNIGGGQWRSTTANGVTVTASASATTTSPADWASVGTGYMTPNDVGVNVFTNPDVYGRQSLEANYWWDTNPEIPQTGDIDGADDQGTGTLTLTFSEPVLNPVLYVDRIGGYGEYTPFFTRSSATNSARLTLNGGLTWSELAGVGHFDSTLTTLENEPDHSPAYADIECHDDVGDGTACGTMQINGTVSSFSLTGEGVGVEGIGHDGIEFVLEAPIAGADLSISKADGVVNVAANGSTTYQVVVTNNGSMAADGAVVTDPVAARLTKTGVTCGSATGGAVCPTPANTTVVLLESTGIVIPTLPSGGSVTFSVDADVTATFSTVTNTASVAPPSGVNDPTPENNTASDTNTVDDDDCTSLAGTDTDGDGINDVCDLDDDNDGILDTVEGCAVGTTSNIDSTFTFSTSEVTAQTTIQTPPGPSTGFEPFADTSTATELSAISTTPGEESSEPAGTQTSSALGTISQATIVLNRDMEETLSSFAIDLTSVAGFDDGLYLEVNGVVVADFDESDFDKPSFNAMYGGGSGTGSPYKWQPWNNQGNPQFQFTVDNFGNATVELLVDRVDIVGRDNALANIPDYTPNPVPIVNIEAGVVIGIAYKNDNGAGESTGFNLSVAATFTELGCTLDTDGDGIPDHLDLDSDNDGISDLLESGADYAALDPDNNGAIDGAQFADADGDGLADAIETTNGPDAGTTPVNSDGDSLPDYLDLDSDDDGIPDTIEAQATLDYGTIFFTDGNVTNNDVDGDGVIDIFDSNDGTTGVFGGSFNIPQDTDGDGTPDYLDLNSDNDAFTDFEEGGDTVANVTYADPNGSVNDPQTNLPNEGGDTSEVAYREITTDLSIDKDNGVNSVDAGGSTIYQVVVTNLGPSTADGAVVTDPAATGLSKTGVTCDSTTGGAVCPAPGDTSVTLIEGAGIVIPTLPASGIVTFSVTADVTATSGSVTNVATVAPPSDVTDPTPDNNTDDDTDTINPQADLSIDKDNGVTTVNADGSTTYQVVVTNLGPSAADGAVVTDPAVAGLGKTGVTCDSTASGAVCPTAGNTTVALIEGAGIVIPTLPASGVVTFSVAANVTATSGSVTNVVTVTAPSGVTDPTPDNNTDDDTDTINPQADLQVSKDDGVTTVSTNGTTTYQFVVTNHGPSAADGAVITDPAVAGLSVTGATSVTCDSFAGGAVCPAAVTAALIEGAGIVIPTLPANGVITFSVTADVTAISGNVINVATVTPPSGVTDPTPGNNTDDDTDTILSLVSSYSITKTLTSFDDVTLGSLVTFTIRIENTGDTVLTTIPLEDRYNTNYLAFAGVPLDDPQPDDNVNDGVINWADLTAAAPYGTGLDIAPNEFVEVVVKFVALLDTSLIDPDGETTNIAEGKSVTDQYGTTVMPDKEASAGVTILNPTAVLIADHRVTNGENGATLAWTTWDEREILGFNLYRLESGDVRTLLNEQPIAAQLAGQPLGAAYSLVDNAAPDGVVVRYILELLMADGESGNFYLGSVRVGSQMIFLPLVNNN